MSNSNDMAPMLTTSDVARILNIHINTVRRWSNQGRLKSYRIGSRGSRRFLSEDSTKFLSQKSKAAKTKRTPSPSRTLSGIGEELLTESQMKTP